MEAFAVSLVVVALGEIGDKTQLLALVLAARYRKPAPILAGIVVAVIANHLLAGLLGNAVAAHVGAQALRYGVAFSFLVTALWTLKADAPGREPAFTGRAGVFAMTLVSFFVAEIGDKTQFATAALAARYPNLLAVVSGTTLGMLLADAPVVLLGQRFASRIPFAKIRVIAALLFLVLAVVTILI